jgi:hypothetical protein
MKKFEIPYEPLPDAGFFRRRCGPHGRSLFRGSEALGRSARHPRRAHRQANVAHRPHNASTTDKVLGPRKTDFTSTGRRLDSNLKSFR